MTRIILFDFDGTIADSFEEFIKTLNILAVKYNFKQVQDDEIKALRNEDARSVIKTLKVPFYTIPFVGIDFKKMQQEHILQIKPFKNLPEVLHKLKERGYSLGILTSNGKENVERFIKSNKIDIFDYIYSDSSMFGKDKFIAKFLKQNSVTKEDILYIGDEIRDIQACHKIGVKIASVTWGFNAKEGLQKYQPEYLLEKPSDLLALLNPKMK